MRPSQGRLHCDTPPFWPRMYSLPLCTASSLTVARGLLLSAAAMRSEVLKGARHRHSAMSTSRFSW
eukprot:CAMPEP_0202879860 /NCGR_PEP_ID=MMETSP1391-20130828/34204_1 /ASSEMBLY_ACC=CAM_ASM_000867 /TAXON_ID=1034604 /ORGANISM="Chlamydomonas leiostraca, Strain SAG 11-49" /LENGTH=65 /DNA_ID=CAMNT_0049562267 /DNA_START=133 /DNA_END=330 /DNA_ORIENTATION=-